MKDQAILPVSSYISFMLSFRLVVTSRSEKDRVVSVPAEGSITSSVSSVVDMVGSCVGRGCIGVTASWLRFPELLLLRLSGLSHQAGHSVDGESLTHQG